MMWAEIINWNSIDYNLNLIFFIGFTIVENVFLELN